MKFVLSIIFAILLFQIAVPAWSTTYFVTQSGAGSHDGSSVGNAFSVSEHNGETFSPGDIIYVDGNCTSKIIPPSSGDSNNSIIYDGYEGGDCSTANETWTCASAAIIDRSGGGGGLIEIIGKDYITVQDFELRDSEEGFYAYNDVDYITVRRCYINTIENRGVFITDGNYNVTNSYITVGGASGDGNLFLNVGMDTAGSVVKLAYTTDGVISYNTSSCDDSYYGYTGLSWEGGSERLLIEYNTVHDYYGDEEFIGGKGGTDIIIRFNTLYDYNSGASDSSGITLAGNWENFYVYGNSVKNSGIGIYIYDGPNGTPGYYYNDCGDGDNPDNAVVWANVIYDTSRWSGILVGSTSCYGTSNSPDDVLNLKIYNNTLVMNAASAWNGYETGIHFRGNYDSTIFKNNILYQSRPNESDYEQMRVADTSNVTLDYNMYYWPSQTGQIDWGGTNRSLAWVQANTSHETSGSEENPDFTNVGSDDFTLGVGSPAIDNGENLAGLAGSVTVQGATYNMYYQDALHPYTDHTAVPPDIITVQRTTWDQGAYETDEDSEITVTVSATDPSGAEEGQDVFVFTVACSPDCNATAVSLSFPGTSGEAAELDVDFNCDHESSITITGASDTVTCTPVDDGIVEGNETAYFEAENGSGYIVGSPSTAEAIITDNDSNMASHVGYGITFGGCSISTP